MYRLGPSLVDSIVPRDGDMDSRNSFMNPATPPHVVRRTSGSLDSVGGGGGGASIYDPSYYTSLFPDNHDEESLQPVNIFIIHIVPDIESISGIVPDSDRRTIRHTHY